MHQIRPLNQTLAQIYLPKLPSSPSTFLCDKPRIYTRTTGTTIAFVNKRASCANPAPVLVKAKNFLVFQGDAEAVASARSPRKLTEQISGSLELAREYENATRAQERGTEPATFNFTKLTGIKDELKDLDRKNEKNLPELRKNQPTVDSETAEDGVFAQFCHKIKLSNIREYEGRQLKQDLGLTARLRDVRGGGGGIY
ncbi:hypothetical protein JOM56_012837 [Amanita muscaria]